MDSKYVRKTCLTAYGSTMVAQARSLPNLIVTESPGFKLQFDIFFGTLSLVSAKQTPSSFDRMITSSYTSSLIKFQNGNTTVAIITPDAAKIPPKIRPYFLPKLSSKLPHSA